MDMDYKLIGKRIQRQRKTAKLTQEQLAEKLNVSVGYISQIERGITKVNLNTLSRICNVLNCDIACVITGTTVNNDDYLNIEFISKFNELNDNQKKMVVDFIELIKSNNA